MHAEIVLKEDVNDYAPLFGEIADAYFDQALYPEAGQIYEALGGELEVKFPLFEQTHLSDYFDVDEQYPRLNASSGLPTHGGRHQGSSGGVRAWCVASDFPCHTRVDLYGASVVLAADTTNKDAKMKLAEMYESLGDLRKALDLVLQGMLSVEN